jgi:PAS domain S-box-containing protein
MDSAHVEGVYGVDREGRATLVTPSVAAMTGYALADLIGRPMHEVLHHSHADGRGYPRAQCPIYAAFRDGQTHQAAEVFWCRDGRALPVTYTSMPLVERGELVGAVVVFRKSEAVERESADDLDHLPLGESPAWRATMELVRRVAAVPTTVLLLGESGTGKELVARAIHQLGPRRTLIKLNCAAVPANLLESELFGHERGAFTGATVQRIGRFEQAAGGTLLLDEVGELPLEAQAKLLRVLQEREFERVGGARTLPCTARIIAATNRDLAALVAAGRFRADLYHRLSVFPITLPPLRARRPDIPLLAAHFLRKLERKLARPLRGFGPASERRLLAHGWPGNVRELENVVERAALLADGPIVEVPELRESGAGPCPAETLTLQEALVRAGGKVTGVRGAAALLGVHPNTLRYRMRKLRAG